MRLGSLSAAVLLLVAGCGGPAGDPPESASQTLRLAEVPTLELTEREDALVFLTVFDAQGEPTFSAQGLPGFARLQGNTLRLSPQPGDAGEYALTLTATDGQHSDSQQVQLRVSRNNTAPSLVTPALLSTGDSAYSVAPGATLQGPLFVWSGSRDAENDPVRLCAEVVPFEAPFTESPTHSTALRASHDTYGSFAGDEGQLALTGLQDGVRYKLAAWLEDEGGLRSARIELAPDFTYEDGL